MVPTKINVGLSEDDRAEPTAGGIWQVTPQVAQAARRQLVGYIELALAQDPVTGPVFWYVDRAEVVDDEVVIIVNHRPGGADQIRERVVAAVDEWLRGQTQTP